MFMAHRADHENRTDAAVRNSPETDGSSDWEEELWDRPERYDDIHVLRSFLGAVCLLAVLFLSVVVIAPRL
jgi:hypothetical protein